MNLILCNMIVPAYCVDAVSGFESKSHRNMGKLFLHIRNSWILFFFVGFLSNLDHIDMKASRVSDAR